MAFAFQRIVCVALALFYAGASGAPAEAVTSYDQRQQGEYNVQVDVKDVAIMFIPGSEFAQRTLFQGGGHAATANDHHHNYNNVNKAWARHRNAIGLKHKNKPTEATMHDSPATSTGKPPLMQGLLQSVPLEHGAPQLLASVPSPGYSAAPPQVPANDKQFVSEEDPYSVTPSTANFSEIDVLLAENGETTDDCYNDEMVAVKIIEKPEVSTTVGTINNNLADTVGTQNVESPADVKVRTNLDSSAEVDTKLINDFGEKQVASSDPKTTEQKETPAYPKPEDKSNETMPIKTTDHKSNMTEKVNTTSTEPNLKKEDKPAAEILTKKAAEIPADTATIAKSVGKGVVSSATNVNNPDTQQDTKKTNVPIEMVAMKTIEKPVDVVELAAESVEKTDAGTASVNKPETTVDTKKVNGSPVEMVTMRTVEKPTFIGALQTVRNPAGGADAAAAETGVTVQSQAVAGKKPTELVAMKKIEKPLNNVTPFTTSTVDSRNAASTKPATTLHGTDDAKPAAAQETVIVSKTITKPIEMVAVKTVENPTTVAAVLKSVLSVKAVIKPGSTPKTTHTVNGTSIMRKVGDRKPLPSITLEVASPKVVGEN